MQEFKKNCPGCGIDMIYNTKNGLSISIKHNTKCGECKIKSYVKNCPACGAEMKYEKYASYKSSLRNNYKCSTCAEKYKKRPDYSGSKNPFFGKKHGENARAIMSDFAKKKIPSDKVKEILKNGREYRNSNFKNTYDTWVKKFGKEIADEKYKSWLEKESAAQTGKNNPMYGKPAPNGAGNGWSGWYEDIFFRSLIELSYMVEFLSATGTIWESAETSKFKIEYVDWEGKTRNYFPDYFVNNKYLVEVKPKKLWNTPKIKAKKEAAEKWCQERGYEYLLIDPPKLDKQMILELYSSGKIKFTDRYEKKFKEEYLNE